MTWLARLGVNQRLAILALILGAVALLAHPQRGLTRVDAQDLAAGLQQQTPIPPLELADWIVKGVSDYRLVDVRDPAAFAVYHLPGAENIGLASLGGADLAHNEKIVVYADDGAKTAQAWFVLRAYGYQSVYVLNGGVDGWKREVLFPVLTQNPTPTEQTENERRRQVSARFGGSPRLGGDAEMSGAVSLPPAAMPKVEAPSAPTGGGSGKATPKKKKEGC